MEKSGARGADGGGGQGGGGALPEGFTWQLMVVTTQLPPAGPGWGGGAGGGGRSGGGAAEVLAQALTGGQWAVKNELLPETLKHSARLRQQGYGQDGGAQKAPCFSDDTGSQAHLHQYGRGTAGAGAVVPIKSVGDNGLLKLEITATNFRP